jgi:hypothetical protein
MVSSTSAERRSSVRRLSQAGIAIGTAVAALTLPLAAALPAQAAHVPGWRLIASHHFGGRGNASGFSVVIAPSRTDAWAFGGSNPGGPSTPTAEQWDGRHWRTATLPRGLGGFIIAASASSPRDIWAVSYSGMYVLHWNGSRWSVAKRWKGGEATSIVAISPSDVWVFGGGSSLGAWHLSGRTWHRVAGRAGAVFRASALSASSIWAVAQRSRQALEHYDGSRWAAIATGSALVRTIPEDVVAVSRRGIWVSAVSAAGRLVVAHGSGSRWTRYMAPWRMRPERFAADGSGGIWIPAVTSTQTWLVHLSRSGRWTRTKVAGGPSSGVGDVTLIPGITTMLGSGGTRGNAAIWASGPLPAARARHQRAHRG